MRPRPDSHEVFRMASPFRTLEGAFPSNLTPMRRTLLLAAIILLPSRLTAQTAAKAPAAMRLIREADLKRDLFILAGDSMRGRESGTLDEMRA